MRFLKYVFVSFFIFCTFFANAQNKWKFDATLGAGLSGRHTNLDNGWLISGQEEYLRFVPAFSGGLQATYPIASKWRLRSGLMYQNSASRYTQKFNTVAYISVTRNTFRLHQLQVPLQVQWRMGQKLKTPFLNIGITTNYIIDGQRNIYRFHSADDFKDRAVWPLDFSLSDNQSSRFFIQPTLGFGWQLSERWSWAANFSWGKGMPLYYTHELIDCKGACELGTKLYNRRALLFEVNYQLF